MEEWRSYTTLSSQEKRKDMGTPSNSLRFISSPRGNELTEKAVEMMRVSTLQRNELEKMRRQQTPSDDNEEEWLNSLQSWKSKRNWTLERQKDSSRDQIKSSLSDSIEKGRESGLGSSVFSPVGHSPLSPSSNYILTNFSPSIQPEEEKEKSELDQVLIQLQLLREKKEKGERDDVPTRFTPPLSHHVTKTAWTDVNLDMDKKETSNVTATLHYTPREIEIDTFQKSERKFLTESKRLEKEVNEKMKKPNRMVVDIGLDDPPLPPPSFSSLHRSSYRSSTLNPITPNIPMPQSILYPPHGEKSSWGGGMRMYGSLPRRRDSDYRVISIEEKKGPGKLTDFVPEADRFNYDHRESSKDIGREEEAVLIRNYDVHPMTAIDYRPTHTSIDNFDPRPYQSVDSWTLPSKVSDQSNSDRHSTFCS
ncbi:hypothetical protein PFISCL1PPCAC_10465 [Pristionchus fissidentatus]|uniref:Uncharacterized protein n=1 Tax=Pristionchus fissidentatus TaxID=1538716 RepID=A0AAV5VLK5_9BILA|nr:hypothetical protein PFISCL1PPCAC_10465 [Pristionchus fissidentatus]